MTLTAEEWLAEHHPDEPALPDDDTGKDHRDISLDEHDLGVVIHDDRTERGGRRQRRHVHLEVIHGHADEVWEREHARMSAVVANQCGHCSAGVVRYQELQLCEPCYVYRRRTGELPGRRVVARRQARLAAAS